MMDFRKSIIVQTILLGFLSGTVISVLGFSNSLSTSYSQNALMFMKALLVVWIPLLVAFLVYPLGSSLIKIKENQISFWESIKLLIPQICIYSVLLILSLGSGLLRPFTEISFTAFGGILLGLVVISAFYSYRLRQNEHFRDVNFNLILLVVFAFCLVSSTFAASAINLEDSLVEREHHGGGVGPTGCIKRTEALCHGNETGSVEMPPTCEPEILRGSGFEVRNETVICR